MSYMGFSSHIRVNTRKTVFADSSAALNEVLSTFPNVTSFVCVFLADANWNGTVFLEFLQTDGTWSFYDNDAGPDSFRMSNEMTNNNGVAIGQVLGAPFPVYPFTLRLRVNVKPTAGHLTVNVAWGA